MIPYSPLADLNIKGRDRSNQALSLALRPEFAVREHTLDFEHVFSKFTANFLTHHMNLSFKSIVMVGVMQRVGTSTTASNFAATLAKTTGLRILLIDGNVRKPSLHRVFRTDGDPRMSLDDILTSSEGHICPVRVEKSSLWVLPAKAPCVNPSATLLSHGFDNLLHEARNLFDFIIIDGPPLRECPESLLLCGKVDNVVLVLESGETRKDLALWAKSQVEQAGGRILGVVATRMKYHIPAWLYKFL